MGTFKPSFTVKQATNLGKITPISWIEVSPGDTITEQPTFDIKFAPLVGPVLGLYKAKIGTYFVPYKLIWERFEEAYTSDGTTHTCPNRVIDLASTTDYADFRRYHIAMDTNACDFDLDILPVRAYQKIYYDHFLRTMSDGVPQESTYFLKTSATDAGTLTTIHNDFYSTDYFTKAVGSQFYSTFSTIGGSAFSIDELKTWIMAARDQSLLKKVHMNFPDYIRQLFGLTRTELQNEGKSKMCAYSEVYFTHTEILNSSLTATAPLGAPGSVVTLSTNTASFKQKFTEHGILMNIVSIEPIGDMFGVRKELRMKNKYDFFNPTYQALGHEPITKSEVARNPTTANKNDVLGYMPRYQHLRETRSFVGGEFLDSTPSMLILHRPIAPSTLTDLHAIVHSDYNYIFASYSLPQIRLFAYFDVTRENPKLLEQTSQIPDLTKIL